MNNKKLPYEKYVDTVDENEMEFGSPMPFEIRR